jgi:hypothetical protein
MTLSKTVVIFIPHPDTLLWRNQYPSDRSTHPNGKQEVIGWSCEVKYIPYSVPILKSHRNIRIVTGHMVYDSDRENDVDYNSLNCGFCLLLLISRCFPGF